MKKTQTKLPKTRLLSEKELVDIYQKHGLCQKFEGGLTLLHLAAFMGYSKLVEKLLNAGANLQAKCEGGKTPFDAADAMAHKHVKRVMRRHIEHKKPHACCTIC